MNLDDDFDDNDDIEYDDEYEIQQTIQFLDLISQLLIEESFLKVLRGDVPLNVDVSSQEIIDNFDRTLRSKLARFSNQDQYDTYAQYTCSSKDPLEVHLTYWSKEFSMMANACSIEPISAIKFSVLDGLTNFDMAYKYFNLPGIINHLRILENRFYGIYDSFTPHFGVLFLLGDVIESLNTLVVGPVSKKFNLVLEEVLSYEEYLKNGYLPDLLAIDVPLLENGEPEFIVLNIRDNKVNVVTPHGDNRYVSVENLRNHKGLADENLKVWQL